MRNWKRHELLLFGISRLFFILIFSPYRLFDIVHGTYQLSFNGNVFVYILSHFGGNLPLISILCHYDKFLFIKRFEESILIKGIFKSIPLIWSIIKATQDGVHQNIIITLVILHILSGLFFQKSSEKGFYLLLSPFYLFGRYRFITFVGREEGNQFIAYLYIVLLDLIGLDEKILFS